MRLRAAVLTLTVAVLMAPALADAKRYHFGSTLKAPVNKKEAHPVDSVFWARSFPGSLPGTGRAIASHKGKVATIKIKGNAVRLHNRDPVTLFHFQVLRPDGNGHVRVVVTSGPFHVPVGGDRNRITAYHPVNLCVQPGDYVAFNDVGGFQAGSYGQGTPFRIFSKVDGATTNFYTKAGGTNTGARFKGERHGGEELLMRMALVTGKEAGYCK